MRRGKGSWPIVGVVLVSFVLCMGVSMWSLYELSQENTQDVSTVLAARIYDNINNNTREPVMVSKTMASNNFLVEILQNEGTMDEDAVLAKIKAYLIHLKGSLNYDSVFVVSEKTRRYYTVQGVHKIVDPQKNDHDSWYRDFLASGKPYDLDVDRDEVDKNFWTVFVNARVVDEKGNLLGVCGVGIRIANLQKLIQEYEQQYQVKIRLVDKNGLVQVDAEDRNIEQAYLDLTGLRPASQQEYALQKNEDGSMVVTKYLEPLSWYLVVKKEGGIGNSNFTDVLRLNLGLFLLVMFIIMTALWLVIRRFNRKNHLAQRLNEQLASAANLYSVVREIDILHNTYADIKSSGRESSEDIQEQQGAQEKLREKMYEHTDPSHQGYVKEFLDIANLDERLAGRKGITTEFLDNNGRWVRGRFVVSHYTPWGKVAHVLWLVEDIDEEARSREALMHISVKAIADNKAKSAFLSNMSHELRTPINGILGMNEMVLRECGDNGQIQAYALHVQAAGHTLLALVNNILDFSKIEAGRMEIQPVEYDLSSLIHDLVQMLHFRAQEKGLSISVDVDPKLPKVLKGDEIRIKQIVMNLLVNGIQYTKVGNIVLAFGYASLSEDKVGLKVSVKDTGIGMKPEQIQQLFAKDDRLTAEQAEGAEATGLGIAISSRLLKMMGSKLEVESVYGLGSRFFFTVEQGVVRWEPLGNVQYAVSILPKE